MPGDGDTVYGMGDPTFQQLRVFLVVAEELNFSRAAARLHLAQPPVSRHIKTLEAALGIPLFERTSRGVTLTPAGAMIRREAQHLLRRWDNAVDTRDIGAEPIHRLVLGAIESIAINALPTAIATMRARHHDLAWELSEEHTDELVNGLHAARLDAAVVRHPIPPGQYETVLIHEDELVVALPTGHRLGGHEIELADLASEDFIVYSRRATSGLLNVMVAACVQADFVPRIRHEALGTELVLGLVAGGDGVAMVSEVVAGSSHPGVGFARLRGRPAVSPIVLAWQPDAPTEVMTELADLLRQTVTT